MPTVYYPKLSSLVPNDALPEALGFVKNGLSTLLADFYFKDLQQSESPRGDAAQYSLTVVSGKILEIEIPGTGIALMLNPPAAAPASPALPEFPITLRYEWGILTWVRDFDFQSFSFTPADFYQLALNALGLTERQLLEKALAAFITPSGAMTLLDSVNQMVADINAQFPAAMIPDPTTADPLGEVLSAIRASSQLQDAAEVLWQVYLLATGDLESTEKKIESFFTGLFPGGSLKDYFTKLITPRIEATLKVSAALVFPREILLPLDMIGGNPIPGNVRSELIFDAGTFFFSTERGIGFDEVLVATLTPSQIGSSGFEIEVKNARLDLSRTTNIPEATADGRSNEFVGVFIEEATIKLPAFFNQDASSSARLVGRGMLFGTGGTSGRVSLEAVDPLDPTPALVKGRFGSGFEIGLSAVSLTFKQNAITKSVIRGSMRIPRFKDAAGNDADIEIEITIGADGDFSVTASEDQGIRALTIPGVLTLDVDSLSVGRKGGRFFAAISGTLDFIVAAPLGQFLPDKIDIQRLLVWDDGKIEFEGGKITLPRAVSLEIGPVKLSVTALGYGSHEQMFMGELRQYNYITFDGGVKVDPGGVDVSGNGVAIYYTVDNEGGRQLDRFMRVQSIKFDVVVPGSATKDSAVLLLNGYLSMRAAKPPATGSEYAGAIAFTLPKLKMGGSGAIRVSPSVPAFILEIGLELSTPILLGSTSLAIWGFDALAGLRYVAAKDAVQLTDADPWWKYYKAKVAEDYREGLQISKFSQIPGFSLGAGVSLATTDSGYTFASKIFFLASLPGVFLLVGQGQILKGRILLTDTTDPPFFALIAITKNSIESAFGVNYAVPEDDGDGKTAGGIVTVDAIIQMGFFWGSSASWYLDIGKEPANERVLVRLLSIIDAYFYLEMSGAGIRAGAGASYNLSKRFGPLSAELSAYLDTAGRISKRPKVIGASIRIGGTVELSIFGFGFGISAAASLAAEGTKPFTITGSIEVCVRVLRKDRCAKFELTWIFNQSLDLSQTKLLDDDNLKASCKALNIHTQESYDLWTGGAMPSPTDVDGFVIPMDSFIDVEFKKPVLPSAAVIAAFGGNTMGSDYIEYVAPQRGKTDRVRHEYTLKTFDILYWDGTAWKPYDIHGAAVPPQLTQFITSNPSTLKQGFWQYQEPNRHNKLRVLALSPLTFASQGSGDLVPEDSGITTESIFCAPAPIAETCTNFDDYTPLHGTVVLPDKQRFFHQQFQFRIIGADGSVVDQNSAGHTRAVRAGAGSAIEITLIEPAVLVRLKLNVATDTAVVRFYAREPLPPSRPGLNDRNGDVLVATKPVARGVLVEVLYDDITRPVEKIVIEAGECRIGPPLVCDSVITPQARDLEHFLSTLVGRGEHTSPKADLLDCDFQPWNGIFFNTALFAVPDDPAFYRYVLVSSNGTELHGRIADWRGFNCAIDLTLIEGATSIDWKQLTAVRNLRIDDLLPHVAGPNYTFLIDGDVSTPKGLVRVTLRGRSCYPILNCAFTGVLTPGPITAEAAALGDLLSRIASQNRLLQPRVKLSEQEMAAYDRTFAPAGRRAGVRKVWLTTTSTTLPTLDLLFMENGIGGTVSLALPEPRTSFHFDQINGFEDIRADRSNLTAGVNHSFLIDARVRTAAGETMVTLRGQAPFTVFTASDTEVAPPSADVAGHPSAVLPRFGRPRPSLPPADCAIYLSEVCLLDYPSAAFNATLPSQSSVDAEVVSITNAVQGSIQPLWRPSTRYAIRVVTRDTLYREGNSNEEAHFETEAFFGFYSAGPPGHVHIYRDANGNQVPRADYAALEAQGHGDEFKLIGLLHYLDFAKSNPDPSGQLINAKPLYFSNPKLLLCYLQTYVARMFCDWAAWGGLEPEDIVFEVLVKDPAPDPNVPEAGTVAAQWTISPIPIVSRDITILNNMITHGSPCGSVTEIKPTWLNSEFPLGTQLQAFKLYTAIFNLRYKKHNDADFVTREVLHYCFRTSQYGSLAEQIDSYKLEVAPDGTVLKAALFEITKAFPDADLATAASVLADTLPAADPLRQMFADPFNRLIDGVLKLGAIDPPGGSELNIVRDTTSGRVLGILFKNREPLNDPKLSAADVAGTIRLSVNGGSEQLYQAIFSKDLSQAFLTNADNSMSVPAGAACRFSFDYKEWDGSAYVTAQSAQIDVVLP